MRIHLDVYSRLICTFIIAINVHASVPADNKKRNPQEVSYMQQIEEKEWLTVVELQRWLAIGRWKAYRLIETGELPAHRVGRLIRIRRSDVEAWLAQHRYCP